MCQFIETIRMEGGRIWNLAYHRKRMENTMLHFWKDAPVFNLEEALDGIRIMPDIHKIRLVYGENGVEELSVSPYKMKKIKRLRIVKSDDIDYTYKSVDRSGLTFLQSERGTCDDVIIVRNGLLTDTSYSNIALYDGNKWITPRFPLLQGTMRQSLLDNGDIVEGDISVNNISDYESVCMINAMMPLGRLVIPADKVLLK